MAINGEIKLIWGDGENTFNIARLKCVLELEEKCNAGIAEVYQRVSIGRWRLIDVRETLRLGLIGAGMPPDKALRLINRYCDDRPYAESVLVAQAILAVAMVGVPGDDLEKKAQAERAKDDQSTASMERSPAPSSTDSVPPSDSTRAN
jgi:Phage tail tube protein, GTA-gp10